MLAVDFDPTRPRDEGQFHVRLIDAKSGDYGNDAPRQSQVGYWCDLGHLRSGVLAPIEAAIRRYEERDRGRRGRWWITTDLLSRGGQKVLGPFETDHLASTVRMLLENARGTSFWLDNEECYEPLAYAERSDADDA